MALNSRTKGKVGELDLCHKLSELFGWHCHRTQQHTGWNDGNSPDIEADETPDLFWEAKRVERLNVGQAIERAAEQCGRRCPVLAHRRNRGEWLLTIRLSDLPRLVHAYERATSKS